MKLKILYFLIIILISLAGCKNKDNDHAQHQEETSYYTCPMHPSARSNSPGSCPVCNMSLIKVDKVENSHQKHEGNFVTLDSRQQLLAGIKTATIKSGAINSVATILGTVALDEEQITKISSRVKGRIDKLYVRTLGEFVKRGSPIYSVYSEELFADLKEYIILEERKKQETDSSNSLNEMLLLASKNKLLLYGLSERQIIAMASNKKMIPVITFYAQTEGYATEIFIREGMYVEEGTVLLTLSGLKKVWVETQIYANDQFENNDIFDVFTQESPNDIYKGTVVYNNPVLEEGQKIQLLRIRVNNSKNTLVPGMMVYVRPKKTMYSVLTIPKSSVLLEKMKTVWVKTDDTTFEQRMVETGKENKETIEILSGLKEGEVIVTSGAYLISSEFILKNGTGQRHNH